MAKSKDKGIGCAAIIGIALVLAVLKAIYDFFAANPVILVVLLAVIAAAVVGWLSLPYRGNRHTPAIAILKLMCYPDDGVDPKNQKIIAAYLRANHHSLTDSEAIKKAIDETKASAASLGEYLEAIVRSFDSDEEQILLDHARRLRAHDKTSNELAEKLFAEVEGMLAGEVSHSPAPNEDIVDITFSDISPSKRESDLRIETLSKSKHQDIRPVGILGRGVIDQEKHDD